MTKSPALDKALEVFRESTALNQVVEAFAVGSVGVDLDAVGDHDTHSIRWQLTTSYRFHHAFPAELITDAASSWFEFGEPGLLAGGLGLMADALTKAAEIARAEAARFDAPREADMKEGDVMDRMGDLAALLGIAGRECEVEAKTYGVVSKQTFHSYTDAVDNFIAEMDDRRTVSQSTLDEVAAERTRQEARWGQQNHPPALWHLILAEEVGELAMALTKSEVPDGDGDDQLGWLREARGELIQVAAVAVAMAESLDRNELAEVSSE